MPLFLGRFFYGKNNQEAVSALAHEQGQGNMAVRA